MVSVGSHAVSLPSASPGDGHTSRPGDNLAGCHPLVTLSLPCVQASLDEGRMLRPDWKLRWPGWTVGGAGHCAAPRPGCRGSTEQWGGGGWEVGWGVLS